MSALRIGVLAAAVVAGPPLYALVETGGLDSTAAVGRGAIVALACTIGVSYVQRLAARYEQERDRLDRVVGQDLPPGTPPAGSGGAGGADGSGPGDPAKQT